MNNLNRKGCTMFRVCFVICTVMMFLASSAQAVEPPNNLYKGLIAEAVVRAMRVCSRLLAVCVIDLKKA